MGLDVGHTSSGSTDERAETAMSNFMASESWWLLALAYLMRMHAHLPQHPLVGSRPLISQPRVLSSHDQILSFAGNSDGRHTLVEVDVIRYDGDVRAHGDRHNRRAHHGRDLLGLGAVVGSPHRAAADKYCNPTPKIRCHARPIRGYRTCGGGCWKAVVEL